MSATKSCPAKSTGYAFVINNYTEEDVQRITELKNMDRVTRLVCEKEIGKEGTPHLQGYISFKKAQTMKNVEKWLGGRVHLEKPRKSPRDNFYYCTKDNTAFVIKGFDDVIKVEQNIQKKKKDSNDKALEILTDIKDLPRDQFIQKHASFYLYKRSIYDKFKTEYEMEVMENYEGNLKDKNFWVYGSAGSGKSMLAAKWLPEEYILRKTSNKWFDGYTKKVKLIVIDDLCPNLNDQSARTMKNLADRYKFVVEVKNSTIVITPKDYCLLITTNYTLEQIFPNEADIEPIKRRFTVINMDEVNKFNAAVEAPKYLSEIYTPQEQPETISEAISLIDTDVPETERVEKVLSEIKSQHNQTKQKTQEREIRSQIKKRATFADSSSSEDISPTDWSDLSNPHPVFQGKLENSEESDSESEIYPPAQRYIPTESEIADFGSSEEEGSLEPEVTVLTDDPKRNHSQNIEEDPLLEYLENSDEE